MILAFDTSAPHCAAALINGDQVLASAHEPMAKGQAERLLVLCQELLDQSGVTWQQLSAIGVGIGPGNFTGIRIAVSAARGLALGLGVPAVGVSGFDALRHGTEGACACAIDARRDQIYLQGFDNPGLEQPVLYPVETMPFFDGPLIGANGILPIYPVAVAIAMLTARRFSTEVARPAPLYLRAADAAPPRDAPPTILL